MKPLYWRIVLFLFALIPTTAQAYTFSNTLSCPGALPDKKFAVFVLSDSEETTGVSSYDPKSGKEMCLLVSNTASGASFSMLSNTANPSPLFDKSWTDVEVNREVQECMTSGWNDTFTVAGVSYDKPAKDVSYDLVQKVNIFCNQNVGSKDVRVRYRVEAPGGDKYLYFVGYHTPQQTAGSGGINWDNTASPIDVVLHKSVYEKNIKITATDPAIIESVSCNTGATKWAELFCENISIASDKKSATLKIRWELGKSNYEIGKTYMSELRVYKSTGLTDYVTFPFGIKVVNSTDSCAAFNVNPTACNAKPGCKYHETKCLTETEFKAITFDCKKLGAKECQESSTVCTFINESCKSSSDLTAEELRQIQKTYLVNRYPVPENNNFMPDCAYHGTCDDVNDLLVVLIKLSKWLFSIIGSVAFVMFVYGGMMMVLSGGSSDKVQQGKGALVAAVAGIVIAFSAYLIVDFILDALQVTDEYRSVGTITDQAGQK